MDARRDPDYLHSVASKPQQLLNCQWNYLWDNPPPLLRDDLTWDNLAEDKLYPNNPFGLDDSRCMDEARSVRAFREPRKFRKDDWDRLDALMRTSNDVVEAQLELVVLLAT